jgi:hypothetical protein
VVKESPHMKLIITYFKSLDTLILGLQISKTRRLHCFEHYIAWAIYSCHHFQDFGLSSLSVCWLPQSKTSIQKSVLYIHVTLEYLIKFGYLIYIFYFLKSSQLSYDILAQPNSIFYNWILLSNWDCVIVFILVNELDDSAWSCHGDMNSILTNSPLPRVLMTRINTWQIMISIKSEVIWRIVWASLPFTVTISFSLSYLLPSSRIKN